MSGELSERLWREARAVEALVFEAFKGVTREGGVSWHEAEAIDFHLSDEELEEALAKDTEKSWEELLDDVKWRNQAGEWAWPFFDAIGFRYYLAPALIHSLRGGGDEFFIYVLGIGKGGYQTGWFELCTPQQRHVVARFLRWQLACNAELPRWGVERQQLMIAYRSGWDEWDQGGGEMEELIPKKRLKHG